MVKITEEKSEKIVCAVLDKIRFHLSKYEQESDSFKECKLSDLDLEAYLELKNDLSTEIMEVLAEPTKKPAAIRKKKNLGQLGLYRI